jgi:hypothetical protein
MLKKIAIQYQQLEPVDKHCWKLIGNNDKISWNITGIGCIYKKREKRKLFIKSS